MSGVLPEGRIDPKFLERIKERVNLAELVSAKVVLKKTGRDWAGLCPFHHERHASFNVIEDRRFYFCHGCGASGDCFEWIMRSTNAREFREAVAYLATKVGLWHTGPDLAEKAIVKQPNKQALDANAEKKKAKALDIWQSRVKLCGSLGERYLREMRHIRVPIPANFGFVPALEHPHLWPHYPRGRAPKFPAIVAAIQKPVELPDGSLETRAIVGVHCTYLAADGRGKAPRPDALPAGDPWKTKIMRGDSRGGAVRLTAAEDIMLVGEGNETSLALLQGCFDPEVGCAHIDGEPVGIWAALSKRNLGPIWLPDRVREVRLCIDNDDKIPDADNAAAADPEALIGAAVMAHKTQCRDVKIARPPPDTDFNDMLAPGAGFDAIEGEDAA
jgi:DNA primase